jgi:hypothetical protein
MRAMNKLRCLVFLAVLGLAAPAFAQTPLDPLDDHSAKRLDRMEQVIKELRAIVFQGRETGKPVIVEPADTDAQMSALSQTICSRPSPGSPASSSPRATMSTRRGVRPTPCARRTAP